MQHAESTQNITFVAPRCSCCAQPELLHSRTDLGADMAVCPQSGQLYRPGSEGYAPADLPRVTGASRVAQGVRIDLSRAGYA